MLQQLRVRWEAIEPNQKRTFTVLATTFLAVALVGGFVLRTRGAMTVLYSNLSPTESREIAAELSRMGIEARISDDEAGIMVPAADEPKARMRLAGLGLPHSSPPGDWDLFDRSGLAVTESQQEAMKIRALQGSLARSIASLDVVAKAAVHITLPERSPFLEDSKPAKAAVLLHLKGGRGLDRQQAQAIAFLVSNSVPDLGPENVTILDEKGALLFSDNVAFDGDGGTKKVEQQLQAEVQSLLDATFGIGKTIVRAAVDLETDRVETVAVDYQPADVNEGTGLPASETTTSEDARGLGTERAGGGAGTTANLFAAQPGGAGGGGVGEYNRTETERTFDNPRTETVTVKPPGGVKRISLGIFIDEGLAEQQTKIETVARAAAGIDTQRGDTVSVEAVKFATTELGQLNAVSRFESIKTIVRWILNAVALIVGLILLKSMVVAMANAQPGSGLFATADGRLAVEAGNGELKLLSDKAALEALRAHMNANGAQLPALTMEPDEYEPPPPPPPPVDEVVRSMQARPVDDIAEVVRHWLEGSLDG